MDYILFALICLSCLNLATMASESDFSSSQVASLSRKRNHDAFSKIKLKFLLNLKAFF